MKAKKILTTGIALLSAVAISATALTGCTKTSGCEHVYMWTTEREATCSDVGKERGLCDLCGDVLYRSIVVDENNHVYGEWAITNPTETEEGEAVKTCTLNPEHVKRVTLPVVTPEGTGYTKSERKVVPTATAEGSQYLELNDEDGLIAFTVTLPKREINTVSDAVTLAESMRGNIRSASGYFTETKDGKQFTFSSYFGDNYTHVTDDGNLMEYWYSKDDNGTPYGIGKYDEDPPVVVQGVKEENLYGVGYNSGDGSGATSFYGAEMGLSQIYGFAKNEMQKGTCVGYQESPVKANDDGTYNLWFSFSFYDSLFFYRYKVNFTTFKSGAIRNLTIETEIIRGYMIAEDEDGVKLFYKEGDYYEDSKGNKHYYVPGDVVFGLDFPSDPSTGDPYYATDANGEPIYETDANGNYVPLTDINGMILKDTKGNPIKKKLANVPGEGIQSVNTYYSDDHPQVSYRTIHFEQVQKKDTDEVIPNPYPADSQYITTFNVDKVWVGDVNSETEIPVVDDKVSLPTNKAVYLHVANYPALASLSYDPIQDISVIDPTGNKIPLDDDQANGSQYRIMGVFNSNCVLLSSAYAGEVTLRLAPKSGKCEYFITINFERSAPTSIIPQAYDYSAANGKVSYTWKDAYETKDNFNPSTGEVTTTTTRTTFNVYVGQPVKIRARATDFEASYVDPSFTASEGTSNGDGTYTLVFDTAGTHTVTLTTILGGITSTITFNVSAKPDIATMLNGNTFTGKVHVFANGNIPVERDLTASFADGKITVTVNGKTATYDYTVTDGVLSTQWVSGFDPNQKTYDFSFTVDEAFTLIVSHGSGRGNDVEKVALSKAEAQA